MGFAVLLTLFPLVALSACPQGGGNCPAHVGRGLLQASVESTVATHVSGETAKRLLQGLHVNTTDIGIYLQSLVAKVDGHNYTLSKPEKTALETIGLMVGKMQNASVMQHAEDQQEVNRMRDLIQNCTSDAAASLAKVAAFKESASSTRKAHAACRQVEGSAKDDKTLACTTYQAHRETTTPPTCMSTELSAEYVKTDDAAKKKQMEACLVMVKSWLTPFHAKYEECKSKTDTHKNKSAECGAQQQAFEQAFCLYESKLEDTCTAQNSCRAKMIAARNSSHDGVKLAEAARKADFTASNRLLCFLDVLRANNTHKRKTLLECQNQSKQTSKFDIVYQDIPGASDCQPELTKPCDSSWQLQEYQSQAWHSKAKMEVCKPCQAPTTTTTTTQKACEPGTAMQTGNDSLVPNTTCTAILCRSDEYVSSNACKSCAPGTENAAGDDASGVDTSCTAILCQAGQRVQNNSCHSCPAGSKNVDGGHDASGADTSCDPIQCGVDHYVKSKACHTCPAGKTRAAGDNATEGDTKCDATLCKANHKVVSKKCEGCPPGKTNVAGDDSSGADSRCDSTICTSNQHVVDHACTACPDGTTRPAGDDASGKDTACKPTMCPANQFVQANACKPCPAGQVNGAGDDASGADTTCKVCSDPNYSRKYLWACRGFCGCTRNQDCKWCCALSANRKWCYRKDFSSGAS